MILHTTGGSISVAARPANTMQQWSSLPIDSLAGQGVTPSSALALAAVFGAVSLIADANGIMPLEVIDQRAATGRRLVEAGWLPAMLQHEPNGDMSGVDLWTFVNVCLLLRGNAYLAKLPLGDGSLELYPMLPETVTPFRGEGGRKLFRVRIMEGETHVDAVYTSDVILHIKGRSMTDPLIGSSPISCARHALGTQLAQQEYQARAYSDGMLIKGVLSTPAANLTPEAADRIKSQWRSAYGGVGNSHDVAVLHSGTTFQGVSMSPEDAQFIQTMKWGHTQIATLYKIPASRLNGDSGSSMRYANVAQDDLYMDKQACLPLRRQIEAALNRDTSMFGARSAWVPKFNPAVALQADLETRTRVADIRLRNGSLSVNDYRTSEDEPTIGPGGDVYAASAPVAPAVAEPAARSVEAAPVRVFDPEHELRVAEAGAPRITLPEVRVDVSAPPAPQVQVDVHVPEQVPPEVRVDVAAPNVQVDVAAPDVHIEAHIDQPAKKSVTIERDGRGFITGAKVSE